MIPSLATQPPAITSPSSIGLSKLSMHGRHHSLGTNPSMHRVTRRKSVSSTATNLAAVAQAVKEGGDVQLTLPPPNASMISRSVGRGVGMSMASGGLHSPTLQTNGSLAPLHGYPSPPSSLPNNDGTSPLLGAGSLPGNGFTFPRKVPVPSSPAPANGGISNAAATNPTASSAPTNRRVRRASEGAHVLLGGEESGRGKVGVELKCDKCGKGYKHSSCLTKHLFVSPPSLSKFCWTFKNKNPYPTLVLLSPVCPFLFNLDGERLKIPDPFQLITYTLLHVILHTVFANVALEILCLLYVSPRHFMC